MSRRQGLGIKVGVVSAIAMGCVFALLGCLSQGFSWATAVSLFFIGLLIGAVAAPEFEPKAFRYPILWQVTTCALSFTLGAILFGAPAEGIAVAALAGVIVGYLAPFWIKHI